MILYNLGFYLPFLISLSERDRKLLIFFLIFLIVVFVLIAYIGEGIRKLMQRHVNGIDSYMYDLCDSGLVKNKKDFAREVRKKETKRLYFSTKWIFRVFVLVGIGFFMYASFANPSGDHGLFYFTKEHLQNLKFTFEVPRGSFFFFENFIIDFPKLIQGPTPILSIESIFTYTMLSVMIITIIGITGATLRFIARIFSAGKKGRNAFEATIEKGAFANRKS